MSEIVLWLLPDLSAEMSQAVAAWVQAIGGIAILVFTAWMVALSRSSVQVSERTITHLERAETERFRPHVVLDFVREEPKGKGYFVAKNLGPGLALNTYRVSDPTADTFEVTPLGAIPPEEIVVLPDTLQDELTDHGQKFLARDYVYVVAEPADQGMEWSLSSNFADVNHRVIHEMKRWQPSSTQQALLKPTPIRAQLAQAFRKHVGN